MSRHSSRPATRLTALATALALCGLAGCSVPGQDLARVSQAASVDVPAGKLVVDEGAHAQGQAGCTAYELELDASAAAQLEERLAASQEWQALPASEALAATLWGAGATGIAPAGSEDFLPRVTNGWVLFRDNLAEEGTAPDPDSQLAGAFAHGRVSVTVGLYDADARVLYLYQVDS